MEKLTIFEMKESNLLEWLVINSITKKGMLTRFGQSSQRMENGRFNF